MPAREPPSRGRGRTGSSNGERVGERLIAIFVLGLVLINPLVIDVFDRGPGVTVLGIPLLFAYLFSAWTGLILLLAWVIEGAGRRRPSPAGDRDLHAANRRGAR